MVKLRHRGLLVLGITREELNMLREGMPMPVKLDDMHSSLKGQMIMLIPGENNESLNRIMQTVADAYQNGATSPIEIAKTLPKRARS